VGGQRVTVCSTALFQPPPSEPYVQLVAAYGSPGLIRCRPAWLRLAPDARTVKVLTPEVSVDPFYRQPTLTSIREDPDNFLDKLHYTTRSCKCPRSSKPCPPSPCPPRYERRLATMGTPSPWGSRPVGDPAFRSSGRDSSVLGPPFGDFDVRHGTRSGLGVPRGWRHLDQPYLSCHELRHDFLPD
jgi:hypothetical protein